MQQNLGQKLLELYCKANFAKQTPSRGKILSQSFKDDVEKFNAKFVKEHVPALIEYATRGEDYYTFDHSGFSRNVVAYVLHSHGIIYYEMWETNCSLLIEHLAGNYTEINANEMFFVQDHLLTL